MNISGSDEHAKLAGASLSERVYAQLEDAILSNSLKSGESLVELKLCEELGVSRTPVREAIRMLHEAGLVEIIPHRGAVVLGIGEKDIEDIYTIRMYVEGLAAKWAAERVTEEQMRELAEIVDLQEFYISKNLNGPMRDLDSRFHERLYQYSGSRTLSHILGELHRRSAWFRKLSFDAPGRAADAVEEHRQILDALAVMNGDLAETLTVDHIANARDNLLEILKNREQE